ATRSLQERERLEKLYGIQKEEYGKTTSDMIREQGREPGEVFDPAITKAGRAELDAKGNPTGKFTYDPNGPDVQIGGDQPKDQPMGQGGIIVSRGEHENLKQQLYKEGGWAPGGKAATKAYPTAPAPLPPYVSPPAYTPPAEGGGTGQAALRSEATQA